MNIIIAGMGKIGTSLCEEVAIPENDVTIIDINPITLRKLTNHYDVLGVEGYASYYDTLEESNAKNCDVFIAVTPNDEVNLIACMLAKNLGAKYTISRIRSPQYSSQVKFLNKNLGVNLTINPEMESASYIARMIQFPQALSANTLANNRVTLMELKVTAKDVYAGLSLSKFRILYPGVLVCIMKRNGEAFIPSGDSILEPDDHIYVTGFMADISKLYRKSEASINHIHSILIIGGGKLSFYLLKYLEPLNLNIKVIESNQKRCLELSESFPTVSIIHGDGTDQDFLTEERIEAFDCVITLTGIDEENVIASMFATNMKIPKILTKVNRVKMLKILEQVAPQTIITPSQITANRIFSLIRGIHNSQGSNVEMLYRLADNQVEALQFNVMDHAQIVGKTLMDLPIKQGVLIAYILRHRELIFPQGKDTILPGDHVIVITTHKEFDDIDDILERK